MEKVRLILLGLWGLTSAVLKVFLYIGYLLFLLVLQTLELIGFFASKIMQIVCIKFFNISFWLLKRCYISTHVIYKAIFFSIRGIFYFISIFIKNLFIFIYVFISTIIKYVTKFLYDLTPFLISIPFRIIYLYFYVKDKPKRSGKNFIRSYKSIIKKIIFNLYFICYKKKFLNKVLYCIDLSKQLIQIIHKFFNLFVNKLKSIISKVLFFIYYSAKNIASFIINLSMILFFLLKSFLGIIASIFTKDFWCNFVKELYNSRIFLRQIIKQTIKGVTYESLTLFKHFRLLLGSLLLFLWIDILDFKRMGFYIKNNVLKFFSTIIILFLLTFGFISLFLNPEKYEKMSEKWGSSFIILNTPNVLKDIVNSDLFKPLIYYKTELEVKTGSSLYNSLVEKGIDANNANSVVASLQKSFDLRKVSPRWIINAIVISSKDWKYDKIQKISLPINNKFDLIVEADSDYNYVVYKKEKKLTRYILRRKTLVKGSIYSSAIASGISPSIAMEVFKVLSWDIDFQRDIKENNSLEVVFECVYDDKGELVTCDNLLFASIIGDKTISFYKYEGSYFHEDGKSVIKTLVRTPINNARLSSGFGRRKHPVLGYTAVHKGVDFAAPTGTPIYASGDGVITMKYKSATYGNYIRVRHNPHLSSAYAHMNGFADVKIGDRVKQWQVIGYVGSTGRVTGPHLHYEILINNKQVNPLTVKMPSNMKLSTDKLQEFKAYQSTFNTLAVRIPTRGKVVSPFSDGINIGELETKDIPSK